MTCDAAVIASLLIGMGPEPHDLRHGLGREGKNHKS
jgi:hypothetical protein